MRLLIITRSTVHHHGSGGMDRHVHELGMELTARGHQVTTITTRHPDGEKRLDGDWGEILFAVSGRQGCYSRAWARESVRMTRDLLTGGAIDAAISMSAGACHILELLASHRIPLVTILHGTPLWDAATVARKARTSARSALALPLVLLRYGLWQRRLFRPLLQATQAVICTSQELVPAVTRQFGLHPSNVHMIPNGVNTSLFVPAPDSSDAQRSLGIIPDRPLLVACGRLVREKNMEAAVRALSLMDHEARLVILGDGPDRNRLLRLARRLDLEEKVNLPGAVPFSEVSRYVRACDVFLFPTLRSEGLPTAILEAMACAKPVVAARLGGVPTAVEDGVIGFLVRPGDSRGIAEATSRLLANRDLRLKMGSEARKRVEERFAWSRVTEETEHLVVCLQATLVQRHS